jgi:hypothetical protein
MRHLGKRLLILFLALWLPVSAVAAGTFVLPMTPGAPGEKALPAYHGDACLEQPDAMGEESAPALPDRCHDCALCHFGCTALISAPMSTGADVRGWIAAQFPPFVDPQHVPDQLQRPPLATAA